MKFNYNIMENWNVGNRKIVKYAVTMSRTLLPYRYFDIIGIRKAILEQA